MRKIALIGFNPLEIAGLQSILESVSDCVAIPMKGDDTDALEKAVGYILTPEVFAIEADFFLSRSNRACIIVKGSLPIGKVCHPIRVSLKSDYEDIAAELVSFAGTLDSTDQSPELSNREKDVLRQLASGKTNKEIADALCISVHTVISHRKNISTKLGVKSVSGLSLYALMNGLI